MECAYHPGKEPVGVCVNCGNFICAECKTAISGRIYCNPCAEKIFAAGISAGMGTLTNTSGQGKQAEIPKEIKGWNWGACLLVWIWGIGNRVWLSFLVFIPYLGPLVMPFVLGAKGSEWAWKNKRWDSIEHFRKTQRTWMWWGIGVNGLLLILASILLMISMPKIINYYY